MSGGDGEVVLAVVLSLPKLCMRPLPHRYAAQQEYMHTHLSAAAGSVQVRASTFGRMLV